MLTAQISITTQNSCFSRGGAYRSILTGCAAFLLVAVAAQSAHGAAVFETWNDTYTSKIYTFGSPVESGEIQKDNIGSESSATEGRFAFRAGTVNVKTGGYIRIGPVTVSGTEADYGNWIGAGGDSATLNICGGTFWADEGSSSRNGAGLVRLGVNNISGRTGIAKITLSSGLLRAYVLRCGASDYLANTGCSSPAEMNMSGGTAEITTFQLGAPLVGTTSAAATFNLTGGEMKIFGKFQFCTEHNQTFNWGSGTFAAKAANVFQEDALRSTVITRTVTVSGSPAVFDTGDYAQTIPSCIATGSGTLKLTGGNTVTFAASPSFSLWIDDGTTLNVPSGGLTVPAMTLENGARLVFDSDSVLPGALVAITATGGFTVPEGADVLDFVSITGENAGKCEKTLSGNTITIAREGDPDFVWNGSGANWSDANAWNNAGEAKAWADGNNAIFGIANATATLTANASAASVVFTSAATIAAGGTGAASLTASTVSVDPGVTATISAPTAGALAKTGAGTLVLGSSRSDATTLAEGTLKMLPDATVNGLTLGTADPEKPVVFDYGGQTLSAAPETYLVTGSTVTLTNGVFSSSGDLDIRDSKKLPAVLTVANGAELKKVGSSGNCAFLADGDATINVIGGAITIPERTLYIQHASNSGSLHINVIDGRMECAANIYAICGGSSSESPSLYMMFTNSTFRIINKPFFFGGYDAGNDTRKLRPTAVLAMTNSVFSVGSSDIRIGQYPVVEGKTGGSHTAVFEGSVVTSGTFTVGNDRPLNNARLNRTRLVLAGTGGIQAYTDEDKWITVGADGLVIDTQDNSAALNANLGGSGAVTKIGSGTLTVARSQTSTAALAVDSGTLALAGGDSVARPVEVASGATLRLNATAKSSINGLTLAAGSTLDIVSYSVGVALAATTLNLPEEGTVALTLNGGAFTKGIYGIVSKSGLTAEVAAAKFAVSTAGGLQYEWRMVGDVLVLYVGDDHPANTWVGFGEDGRIANRANWAGGAVPAEGSPLDFSHMSSSAVIIADAGYAFGAVTMGSGVVTFTNSLTAASFSDMSKVAVGTNSTVTIDGDIVLNTSGNVIDYVCYTVAQGGVLRVTGLIRVPDTKTYYVTPCVTDSIEGTIASRGIVNNGVMEFGLTRGTSDSTVNWEIGEEGLSGTKTFTIGNTDGAHATVKASADFTIAANIIQYRMLTLDTAGHTITVGNGSIGAILPILPNDNAPIRWTKFVGSGTVVANYDMNRITSDPSYKGGPLIVQDGATLALKAGTNLGTGLLTVEDGATLKVSESGTVTLSGDLALDDGATLAFNWTAARTAPQLALASGKTLTLGDGKQLKVEVSSTCGKLHGGEHLLTDCDGGFADASLSIVLDGDDDAAQWVKEVFVKGGEIVVENKRLGMVVILL